MQYVIFVHLLVFLGSKSFLVMDKWLNLISKKGHDADDNATKSPQVGLRINKQAFYVRKRKHDESFLQFGFTFKNCNGYEKLIYSICNELLAAESMKPSKLKTHLESKHTSRADKPKDYFERPLKCLYKEKNSFEKIMIVKEKCFLASCKVRAVLLKIKSCLPSEKILCYLLLPECNKYHMKVNMARIFKKILGQNE